MKVVALAAAMLLAAACAGNINPARQNADAILALQVREAIAADSSLRGHNITVNAANGEITLLGVVSTRAQRERAAEVARGVGGVRRVENLLSVR